MGIIYVIYLYLFLGFVFAIYFVNFKIKKIDIAAAKTTFFFKLLIFGGCILLWPAMITKNNIPHT